MSELAYLQVSRICNQACRFCSNPSNGKVIALKAAQRLIDRYVRQKYQGLILTGGEPTLCPDLPAIIRYAGERGIPSRLITNGQKAADPDYRKSLLDAGLRHFHVSLYSHLPEVHDDLTRVPGSLARTLETLEGLCAAPGVTVNLNTVLNKRNAGHLSAAIRWVCGRFPSIRHFVFNNLDPLMSPPGTVGETIPRLKDFELELHRTLSFLEGSGRSFRVERVPLCYMADFAWASTETRKIVKEERRAIYFLDEKGLKVQGPRFWRHGKAPRCAACSLQTVCAGLYQMDTFYSSQELCPVFVSPEAVVRRVQADGD